ncbi:hypothetical protein J6590_048580 [Homalodisca vitripennis]|nr:hypothetical protein J6590_048580 [Homalodisca vitripennis]
MPGWFFVCKASPTGDAPCPSPSPAAAPNGQTNNVRNANPPTLSPPTCYFSWNRNNLQILPTERSTFASQLFLTFVCTARRCVPRPPLISATTAGCTVGGRGWTRATLYPLARAVTPPPDVHLAP